MALMDHVFVLDDVIKSNLHDRVKSSNRVRSVYK